MVPVVSADSLFHRLNRNFTGAVRLHHVTDIMTGFDERNMGKRRGKSSKTERTRPIPPEDRRRYKRGRKRKAVTWPIADTRLLASYDRCLGVERTLVVPYHPICAHHLLPDRGGRPSLARVEDGIEIRCDPGFP
jgi:hypothetical protein